MDWCSKFPNHETHLKWKKENEKRLVKNGEILKDFSGGIKQMK